jgi:hypothetical protein
MWAMVAKRVPLQCALYLSNMTLVYKKCQYRRRSMRSGPMADFMALIGSAGFARGLPQLVLSSRRTAGDFVREFDRIAAPIINETMSSRPVRERVYASLLATSAKLSFLVLGYAEMANVEFRTDLAVLGSALARLYDDMFDEVGGPHIDRQLAQLFGGGEFSPEDNMELLFTRLYSEAKQRLGRSPDDPLYSSLASLHDFQISSRRQRDPDIPADELLDITLGKGGYGLAVLFCMMRPAMSVSEHRLILELGGALQLLDDYQDFELDRINGIHTKATRHSLGLSDVVARLDQNRRRLIAFYGRRPTQRFFAVVYATLWISFFRRRLPRVGTRSSRRGRNQEESVLSVLLAPGDNLVQNAADRRGRARSGRKKSRT